MSLKGSFSDNISSSLEYCQKQQDSAGSHKGRRVEVESDG